MSDRPHPPSVRRGSRQDGESTRAQLLDVAGRLFAEHGYLGTSSKEICLRAGMNMAAVNYHFGSRDGLYEAVLVEAHRQLVSVEDLAAFARSDRPPGEKLRALVAHFVKQAGLGEKSWGFKVVLREVMAPSPLVNTLVEQAVAPKAGIVSRLMAAYLGLPSSHPAVQRGMMLTIFPCIALLIAPEGLRKKVLPALSPTSEGLLEDMTTYILAGLDALSIAHAGSRTSARKARP
ncbi:TetR/AcrR family transcriptional regulator [Luteibacter yeojuensis]|uniref:CerR family C-terminal domain-containing protein n=1 Tax=Luteibacter yeojuensis TaxID=345309 RepID=A0A7X5QSW0_9GAMM|nr:CerR family C-terminal domain-containing protein [Luteibacter yeojuensis]NID14729.1 CerR family C-terminal domain-containing protein [Luteibacter yeojuensis]